MKRLFFLIGLAVLAVACKQKNSFTLNGVLKEKQGKHIYISRVDVNTPILLDSAKVRKNGSFSFSIKTNGPDFYELGYSDANFITILAEPGEKIKLNFKNKNLYEDYAVSGSPGTSKLQTLDVTLADTKRKLDSLTNLYNKVSGEPGFSTKGPEIAAQYSDLIKAQRKKNIEFIINNINSLASIKAIYQTITPKVYVLYEPNDLQYMKIVTDTLTRHYPASKQVQALARDLNNELGKMYAQRIGSMAQDLPEAKLDPSLKDTNGNRISLSSLKGKYVLLAFWSYMSKDCVEENLQLKEYYKKYKGKGFEIYQINVDQDEDNWRKAVKFDELPWISTREDNPQNPVNAKLFNVTALPANYLFDKQGNIIGSNLHGRVLQIKLEQLFSK
jgi:peroxiredoxin